MSKVISVPMIAFFSVDSDVPVDDKLQKLQYVASHHGLCHLLQDELIDPVAVDDPGSISSIAEIPGNMLVEALKELIAASEAPWRTLSNEPDAMTYIERLQSAAKKASDLLN